MMTRSSGTPWYHAFSGRSILAALPLTLLGLGATAETVEGLGTDPLLSSQDPQCVVAEQMPLEGRASPLESASAEVGSATVMVCYGAPSARGRTMIGGDDVPYGEFWRTGANEPTMIHLTAPANVAGVQLEAGSYSLYTRPGNDEWDLFLNRSIDRWGIPINAEVRAEEIGQATLPREQPEDHVETLQFRFEDVSGSQATLVLEWENYRVRIPVEVTG